MIEFAAMTYGLLLSFIFSSLSHNHKRRQKSPRVMIAIGYFLVGVTAALSAMLFAIAITRLV